MLENTSASNSLLPQRATYGELLLEMSQEWRNLPVQAFVAFKHRLYQELSVMVEGSLGVYDVSPQTVFGVRILSLVSIRSCFAKMMTDLVEVIFDMACDLFLRRIGELFSRLPELVREVIEHARGFFHS